MGTKRKIVSSVLLTPSHFYSVHSSPNHLDSEKNLAFPDLFSRNVSWKGLNVHHLAHKKIPEVIAFFKQNVHEVQYSIDHNSYADHGIDNFYPFVCTHLDETKPFQLKNDVTNIICIYFDSMKPEALFIVSDSIGDGKNINNGRNWQAPPKVVEADVHENYYSEIDNDIEESDNEEIVEDFLSDRGITISQKTNSNVWTSIFSV